MPHLLRAAVAAVATVTAVAASGCSHDSGPDTEPVHNPGVGPTPSAGGTPTPRQSSGPTSAPVTTGPVRVRTVLRVPATGATRALSAYVEAHARSVIAGMTLPALRRLTGPAELRHQQQVIEDATSRGLTVPTRPEIAVLETRTVSPRSPHTVELGVCLWLPTTEYVDEVTGVSPAGPVPQTWAPAVATLSEATKTWVVDKLRQPDTKFAPDCGGLS